MSEHHSSVLRDEAVSWLVQNPAGTYIDLTFGGGGHTRAILEQFPEARVIAFDWDAAVLENYGAELQRQFPGRLTVVWSNFAQVAHQLKRLGAIPVDGILADFGTSRMQIETGAGFSCRRDTPLDMRMSSAHHKVTAAIIVNTASVDELMYIIGTYGEERHAKRIAEAIVAARAVKRIQTTAELAALIERVVPRGAQPNIHPATRTFQALRIVVNGELENIEALLAQAPTVLKPGGRLVCISFHSLEDRLVKHAFSDRQGPWEVVTKNPVVPTADEVARNPSARSAKLRVAARRTS